LPDVSGHQVLHHIRSQGPNRTTPVIVVSVLSDRDLGAGFRIEDILTKPVDRQDLLAILRRAAVAPDQDRPILVVDDDPAALKVVEAALRAEGYSVRSMTDPRAALELATAEPPAAVVLDLLMPNLDGFEFLACLRQSGAGRRTPVIVWTMKELSQEEWVRLNLSAQAVVVKAQGPAVLIQELRDLVPHTRSVKAEEAVGVR
jgi:CheY-like chemotaxis protein